jgi:hypothetical protein
MGKEFIEEGKCLGDHGRFQGGLDSQYKAKDFEDVKRYMEETLVKDESPHISWDHFTVEDQDKTTAWCKLICHDMVNDWKKLHDV